MQRVKLGNSSIAVSSLALGTDLVGSRIDRAKSFELMDFYREAGGNFLDTANMYAYWLPGYKGGESETTIGQWMLDRGCRDEMVISSKLGFDYPGCRGGLTAKEIERECDKSLRRLKTPYLDIYQAHRDDLETPLEETMEAFHRLTIAGKIRIVGASNLPTWRIAEANAICRKSGWQGHSVVEQRYTYLRPHHAADFGPQICINNELKQFARVHGITLIAYSILLQGAYTRADRPLPAQFAGQDSNERLKVLCAIAEEAECTPPQVIIAWMRQSSPSILPIIAGSKIEQLKENIDALSVKLTEKQIERLDAAGNGDQKGGWIQPS